jgi:Na+/proline symporter
MPISPDTMRALLILSQSGMALLALYFIRNRFLSLAEYIAWGLLAICVPFLGPFLVILFKPGQKQPNKQ